MTSPFLLHPLTVHLSLSLGLFSAAVEVFPPLKKKVSPRFQERALGLTLLFLYFSAITGLLSLAQIREKTIPLPTAVTFHWWFAVTGGFLFLLLWIFTQRRHEGESVSLTVRRLVAGAGLFSLLLAATLGGHLVYQDRLGTSYMSESTVPEP